MSESDIKREICEFLEQHSDRVLFTVSPPKRTKYCSKFMRNGWPDIYGIILVSSARPFFIEVKKPDGTLGLAQHEILERAKAMGAIACVATCVQDVKKVLEL